MEKTPYCFVVNPTAAGGRTGQMWPTIEAYLLKLGLSFEAYFTGEPGEATELARQAVERGYETVVSVGGDGTINEVVNGLIRPGETKAHARLGIIITGRGSDMARTIGIPSDPEAACERLADPRTMPMDLGLAEFTVEGQRQQRFYCNIAGIGFDGEVVSRADKIHFVRGTLPYLSGLLVTLITWRNRRVEILLDEQPPMEAKVYLVVVANGQYFGGGMRVAPEADPNDGLLDMCLLRDIGKLEFLRLVPRVYEGTHVTHPAFETRRVRRVEIRSSYPLLSELDGEAGGTVPMIFEVVPGALEVLV